MAWSSALAHVVPRETIANWRPAFEPGKVNWRQLVCLDFETHYSDDYTLRKLTTSEYIRDERFEAILVGVKVGTGKTVVIPGPRIAAYLRDLDWDHLDLLCHHTQFDGFILAHHYGIVPRRYLCTLSMARAWLSNDISVRLDDVSRHFGRGGKMDGGKILEKIKGKRYRDLTREELHNDKLYCAQDVEECHAVFRELLPDFSETELELIDATIQMFTCPVIRLDEARARKAHDQEVAEKKALLLEVAPQTVDVDALGSADRRECAAQGIPLEADSQALRLFVAKKIIGSTPRFAALLEDEGVDPPRKISPAWLKLGYAERELKIEKKYAYAFAATDIDFVALGDDPNPRVRDLVEARLSVKSTITVSRAARLLASGANGRPVPVYYKFAGAHTWRFSGGDKQNFQNFTRGGELRLSLMAPTGYVLVVQDSSQIEARVNAWLWGQLDLLEAFRGGRDVYSEFASIVFGRLITRANIPERFLGKTATLGLGYGMGHAKFRATLARDKKTPLQITEEMAQSTVLTYRKMNSAIVAGWSVCNHILSEMAAGVQGEYKCLRWEHETLWLPNGMRLKYPGLKMNEDGEWTYRRKDQWLRIWGGTLCENIVQALARIIVAADQLLAIARVYPVVMTTHDEVVALARKAEAATCLAFMNKTMTTARDWYIDLPLAAEGGADVRYSK